MTTGVTVGICVLYGLFRVCTSSFLDVERNKFKPRMQAEIESMSPAVRADVEKWFLDHKWVSTAGKFFRDEGRYLFCRELEIADDRQSVVVSPVAMMWRSEEDGVPVRVVAEAARLYTDGEFSLNGSSLGTVTRGVISGNVQFRGPDNLRIDGRTFHLNDSPRRLWTTEPVEFQFARHSGRALSGVRITMQSDTDSEGVSAISRVQMNGRVDCSFHLAGRRASDKPQTLKVRAARGFVFDNSAGLKTGTFAGLTPTTGTRFNLRPDNEVWVQRVDADGNIDELICPELRLTFRTALDEKTGEQKPDELQLEHIQAWGRLVEIRSPHRDLRLFCNDVQYGLDQRQLDIRFTTPPASDKSRYVLVRQGRSQMKVAHLRIQHTEDQTLQRLECPGVGQLIAVEEQRKDRTGRIMTARWSDSLTVQQAPGTDEMFVTLAGQGKLEELTEKVYLAADRIGLTMKQDPKAKKTLNSPNSDPSGLFDGMTPKLMTASGNVVVRTAEGTGSIRDELTVRFLRPALSQQTIQTVSLIEQPAPVETDSDPGLDRHNVEGGYSFSSQTASAEVTLPERSEPGSNRKRQQTPPFSLWLEGNVNVSRKTDVPSENFDARGNQLHAVGKSTNERSMKLFGDPATVESADRHLEGARIDLHELQEHADVAGSGRIQFVTDRGLDGSKLSRPAPLNIYWSDRMQFRGRSATFVGQVRVVLKDGVTQDAELQCAGMTAHFADDVTFRASPSEKGEAVFSAEEKDKDNSPLERLDCHGTVTVRIEELAKGNPVSQHRAEFADLTLNMQTGNYSATGPGTLESVAPDRKNQLGGRPTVRVRPNSGTRTRESSFVHVRTDFVGTVSGNIHRREATLSQNVVAIMVPVGRLDEKVDLQETPAGDLPDRSGIMQAEQLTISASPDSTGKLNSFTLIGSRNARLESRNLSASADIITYDHAKQQFIIRAEGRNKVTVNHRSGPSGEFNRTSGNRFEYYRNRNQLKADQFSGLEFQD